MFLDYVISFGGGLSLISIKYFAGGKTFSLRNNFLYQFNGFFYKSQILCDLVFWVNWSRYLWNII